MMENRPVPTPDAKPAKSQTTVAAGTVFLMYLELMILNPLIAPLARELDLAEWQIGAVVSSAALVMVIASPIWGRYGRTWGRRRVLLVTTISGTVAITVFALLTQVVAAKWPPQQRRRPVGAAPRAPTPGAGASAGVSG